MTNHDETSVVRTVGRYHLLEELGRGTMAVVYKGFDPIIGRTVAIKTVAFDGADTKQGQLRERLYREACAAGTLTHPNIVTIYDVLEEGGTTAIAMEFIEGQTLAVLLSQRAPLAIDFALGLFEQIGAALDYAASHGLVHRDIKPANILVTPDGRAKVADFGVARLAVSHLTQTGTVLGSPAYMSPEQIRGLPLDGRSDLFSATIVLYEMLTRERPFAGDDAATTMYRIVNEAPTPANQFNRALSQGVIDLFGHALAKDPADRPPTCASLVSELRQVVAFGNLPLVQRRPMAVPARATPRRMKLLAIAALPIVALLALIVWGGSTDGPEPAGSGGAAPVARPIETPNRVESHPLLEAPPAPPASPSPILLAPSAPDPGPALTGPVSTVPPATPDPIDVRPAPKPTPRRAVEAEPVAQPSGEAMSWEEPPDQAPSADVRLTYGGTPYPVTFYANGRRLGNITGPGRTLSLDAGRTRLRMVNEAVYLDQDLGTITLRAGQARSFEAPATVSAYIGVRGDRYGGLQILIDGRIVPGPYPAQIARIAAGTHRVEFRWTDGALRGVELSQPVSLSDGSQFRIQAIPEDANVAVQKLR